MSSKILIIADIEDNCLATARGLHLAEEMGLEVEVVAFTYTDLRRLKVDKEAGAAIKQQLIKERKASIERRLSLRLGEQHGVKIHVVWSETIDTWITKRASSGDYVAVVKSRHRSESLGHVSTDWHLLRDCSAPVLLVNRKTWKKGATVLATVDLDTPSKAKQKLNEEVVLEARHYAELFNVDVKVLCVLDVPTLLVDLDLIDPKTYAKQRHDELVPVMEALAKKTGLPAKAFSFKRGPVAQTIVSEAAASKAQLVVMGTVGRKGMKAQVIGNTAETVLGLLKTDTLTLKP